MADIKPLVLDVDGTFLRTDMLFECFWAGLGKDPVRVIKCSITGMTRPARLKQALAEIAQLRTDLLPTSPEIKRLAETCLSEGREVLLASASHEGLVRQLAQDHGLSSRVFASDGETNLKGAAKADALVAAFGERGFDYAGNDISDCAIWERSENALIVGHDRAIEQSLARIGRTATTYPGGWKKRDLIRALRPHQWVKNVLLLLPVLAAHEFGLTTLTLVLLGMVAFSAAASSIYIVNDLLDLEADRLHATKHLRPFASGAVPIPVGMLTSLLLGLFAVGLGAFLGPAFLSVVVIYMVLSLAYSLRLKRMRWIDIATLAALYTLRAIGGAAAGQIYLTLIMLVFVYPVFVTLGCVKRLTELSLASDDDFLPGRGYRRADRGDLLNVAALGTVAALLVFLAYTFTEQAISLYQERWLLWLAMVPIAAWLVRMVRLGHLGKQHDDPIVFAMRDKLGLGLIMLALCLMIYGTGLWRGWLGF